MHDTDNHYFDVRQTHDTGMEYVQKKDEMAYSQLFV